VTHSAPETEPEKELLDASIGVKLKKAEKRKFKKHILTFSNLHRYDFDPSKILRQLICEWNSAMDAGIAPAWPPKYYLGKPFTQNGHATETPKAKRSERKPR
jgi:hypothetical protein